MRLTNLKAFLFCAAFLSIEVDSGLAMRLPPAVVPPVVYDGVKYSAPHWSLDSGKKQNGGYIEARDLATAKLLWELRIYRTKRNPFLEGDVQDVFITSLGMTNGYLQITNEKNDTFLVDLKARKVVEGAGRVYFQAKLLPLRVPRGDTMLQLLICVGLIILTALIVRLFLSRKRAAT